ncbi:hypothetical protein TWF788_004686 [Orbilia oligospora]|uniref:F-box domain-containing protein n=1 Tax=Orbilia oligospora TaxID=2813651 RepID=A0A7C8TYI7_ORBOL|nr:hypothetical protein TWF788_004686 [Orbilia oligospora]
MVSLITIPNEILLQIFDNLHLRDLSRAKRTCKHFNTIGKLVTNLNIKFYVDAPNQTAWKLIRSILADNTLGEKISRILVCWRRRNVNRRKTLTKYWQWTDVEKEAIIDACLLWCLTDGTRDAILAGVNSEALLPLLLCYTTRIKSLKLGIVKRLLILFDTEFSLERRVLQAFNSCLSEEDRGDTVGTRRDIANEWGYTVRDLKYGENHQYNYQGAIDEAFLNLIEKHLPKIPWPWDWDQYGLWFEENLETLGEKLPWFRNLENIEVFCQRQTFIDGLLVRFGHFCTDPTKHDELRGKGSNEPSVVEEVVESSDSGGSDSEDEIFPADKHGDTSEEESDEDEDCDQDQE